MCSTASTYREELPVSNENSPIFDPDWIIEKCLSESIFDGHSGTIRG